MEQFWIEFFAQFLSAMIMMAMVFIATINVLARHNGLPLWKADLINAAVFGSVALAAFLAEGWVAMTLLIFFGLIELLNGIGGAMEAWLHPEYALDH